MTPAKRKTTAPAVVSHLVFTGADPSRLESSPSNLFKVLGIERSPSSDVFSFDTSALKARAEVTRIPTKRSVLTSVASVHHPLGLVFLNNRSVK